MSGDFKLFFLPLKLLTFSRTVFCRALALYDKIRLHSVKNQAVKSNSIG